METNPLAARQREIDNVLVRMPASVHALAASAATADKISKNAFFATAVLEVSLTHAILTLDYPANVRHLIAALDQALEEDFPAIGAFTGDDWKELRLIVAALSDVGILSEVRAKPDAKNPSLIVFSLSLSKLGRAVWPRISDRIQEVLSKCIPKELALPLLEEAARS